MLHLTAHVPTAELRDALPLPPREAARALYEQYKRRRGRWESYGHLLGFLAFVSVYLAVLYMQRNAQISYTVHATIKDTIVPSDPVMTSSSDILNWLRGTLERVWKDPVCGDGLCEEPFEFASYGRFGCRADCGDLGALQDLTTVLVDLEFDFRHPVGSVPSTELMKQASWNLCPRHGAPHGLDCYWTSDEEFTRLSGEVHVEITDMPDGDWILVIRRDIFNKVSGAVRAKEALHEDAAAKKIELAAIAADLGREVEVRQMELAVSIGDMSNEEVIADYLNATWEAYRSNITLQNSTGAFSTNGSYNATRFQAWTAELHPFKLDESSSVRYLNVSQLLPGEYVIGASAHAYWYQATHECRNITEIYDASSVFADASSSPVCQLFRQITEAAFARRLQMHRAAIGDRLFVANDEMGFKLGNLSAELAATQPELMAVIASLSGDDPGSFPMQASMRSLAGFYLEPIRGSEPPPPFKSQLSKAALNRLPSSGREEEAESFRQVKVRIQARLAELGSIRDKMESLPEVKAVRAYLAGKNISAATYNYLTFSGGQDAYMTTNLTLRAPQYSGECRQDVPVEQTFATDPISNLTYLKTSVPDINSGFMRFVDLAGCRELCVCEKSACSGGSAVTTSGGDGSYTATYCECSVCVLELKDPTQVPALLPLDVVHRLDRALLPPTKQPRAPTRGASCSRFVPEDLHRRQPPLQESAVSELLLGFAG